MVFFHFAELNAFIIFRIAIAQHLSSIATLDRLVYILTALKFDLALRNRNCLSFSAKEIGSKSLLMVLIRRRSIWWLSYFGMMTSFYSFHFSRKSPSLRHVIKAEAKWCTHCYFQSDIRDSSWSRGLFFIEFIKLNKIKTCSSTTTIQYILQQVVSGERLPFIDAIIDLSGPSHRSESGSIHPMKCSVLLFGIAACSFFIAFLYYTWHYSNPCQFLLYCRCRGS